MREFVKPEVGMGATVGVGSDCYPYTIIEVSPSGKRIKVQADRYKRIDNGGPYTEKQEYTYTEDTNGHIIEASLRKNGGWQQVKGYERVAVGFRKAYFDPHF